MHRVLSRRGACGALGILGAFGNGVASAADNYTLRLAVTTAATSVSGAAAVRYASALGRRSNGQLKIEVYPNSQLASDEATIDGLASGTIDLAIAGSEFMGEMVPVFQLLDMPFLFKNSDVAYRVLEGPIGQGFSGDLERKGVATLGWGTNGFKEIDTVSKPVTVPEDMRGLRMRIPAGPVFVATYQALGAIPVVINSSETFVALSQRTVDAIDNGLDPLASAKFYTYIKHVAMSNHFFPGQALLGAKRKLESLPGNLQKLIRDEARALVPAWRALTTEHLAGATQTLKQNGVTFTEIQYPAFRKAMDPVYATFRTKFGSDFVDRVVRAANV